MDQPVNPSRRSFLIGLAGSALAVAAGCRPAGIVPPTAYAPGSTPLPATAVSQAATATTVLAANAPPDPQYGKIVFDEIFLTPVDNFYVTQYDYNNTPELDAATWTLRVDGLVETPLSINYEQVKAFPSYEEMRTLECIGNPVGGSLIGNATWKGFHIEEILKQVKISPKATHAKFYAADGYTTSVKLAYITQPNVMMAYEMNGAPLNRTHGFPLRIMMPGLYGQKMPRWIQRIEFIDFDYIGYWEGNGYSNIASVQTHALIKSPTDDGRAPAATVGRKVQIQGVAHAAPRLITKIEVRINGGEWLPAKLTRGPNNLTWVQWRFEWVPPAEGDYKLAVRATDETGFVQDREGRGLFSDRDGTTTIHEISVHAVPTSA
jgi:DMSO/TMAO reductase YedYZ molybdopterin-dependent catalytic subunit